MAKKNKPKPVPIPKSKGNGNGNGNGGTTGNRAMDALSLVRAGQTYLPVYPIPREDDGRMGAPSKYDPRFCEMLVDHMAAGMMFETFAAECHVTVRTLDNWIDKYPDFLQAKNLGEPKRLAWWLRGGMAIFLDDPTYQLRLLGVQPFLKKQMITAHPQLGTIDTTNEYHVPRGNTGVYCYLMTNLFRKFGFKNDRRLEHTGKDGGPIKTESKHTDVSLHAEFTLDELKDLHEFAKRIEDRIELKSDDVVEGKFKETK